jgi:endonuclease I
MALGGAEKINFMERGILFIWSKRVFIILVACLLQACSGDDTPTPEAKPVELQKPVAKDDSYETGENEELIVSDLLENDVIYDYGRVSEFDANTSKEGTVVKNNDGTYTFTPASNFIGTDTFSYTLCDAGLPANCSTGTVTVTVSNASPTATEDTYTVDEDKTLKISNYLDNDDLADNATVNEINSDSGNALVTLNDDGSISYTPNEGFDGTDTFTYTLCDDDETPNCSTATITITVVDTGSPQAEDDVKVAEFGGALVTFIDLLANDDLTDDASISSIDGAGSNATITLNEDGSVTYVPAAGFKGEDRFTYTLCDDDAEATCSTATVTVNVTESVAFNIPSDLQDYYDSMFFIQDSDLLYQTLSDFTTTMHVNHLEYTDRHDYLYDADADPNDASMVILMYSGEKRADDEYQLGDLSEGETYNTEHIYPQSKLNNDEAANDLHHMRVADVNINSERLNYPFTDGSGDYKLVNGNSWFPGDDWRGDVARMVMYVNLSYGDSFDEVGSLSLFLEWNREDPVSDFEIQRNNVIYAAQGNRNIFIDNPYIATLIWGGASAENKWQ